MNNDTTTNTTTRGGSRLRVLRVQRGFTQERLSAESGLPRGWVSFLERNPGCMSHTAAAKIARALGVDEENLLCGRDDGVAS